MSLIEILTGQSSKHLSEFDGQMLHKDIIKDFSALKEAALQAGFSLTIASSFRHFERQLTIWNNKFDGKSPLLDSRSSPLDPMMLSNNQKIVAILRWSALPGASRHHWGTDLDIFARNLLPANTKIKLEPWEYFSGHQAPFYAWLVQNLTRFGFFFPYAEDKGGIAVEPWHISHLALAQQLQQNLSLDVIVETIEKTDISGKETILNMLPDIYPRFITNISMPT